MEHEYRVTYKGITKIIESDEPLTDQDKRDWVSDNANMFEKTAKEADSTRQVAAEMKSNMPQLQQEAARAALSPVEKFGVGAGRVFYPEASQAIGKDPYAVAGQVASDVALGVGASMLVPGAGAAPAIGRTLASLAGKGAAFTAPSMLQDQAQRVQRGEGISPLGALGQEAAGAGLNVAGFGLGKALTKLAPRVLKIAVKATPTENTAVNPPNYVEPLEKGLVSMKGLQATSKLANKETMRLTDLQNTAAAIASKGNVGDDILAINFDGSVVPMVEDVVKASLNPKTKLLPMHIESALKRVKFWQGQAAGRSTSESGAMTVEDALNLKRSIGETIKEKKGWAATHIPYDKGEELADKTLYNEIGTYIDEVAPDVTKYTDELAKLVPFAKASSRRGNVAGSNLLFGLKDWGPMAVGATLGSEAGHRSGKGRLQGAVGGLALSSLLSTPAGAKTLYNIGKGLGSEGGRLATQGAKITLSDLIAKPKPQKKKDK